MFKKLVTTLALAGVALTSLLAFAPVNSYAQSTNFGLQSDKLSNEIGAKSVTSDTTSIVKIIANIANALIILIAAVAVIYIIIGAFQWMNGGEDKGKKMVVNAVIGLIIAILAFFIVQFATGTGGWLEQLLSGTSQG